MTTATIQRLSKTALTATLTTGLTTAVPAATKQVIKEIILCNTDTVTRTVTIYAGDGTTVSDTILDAVSILGGETQFYTLSTVLETGELVSGGADAGAVVSCRISGVNDA